MSIDTEITRINEGIANVHLTLYKFTDQLKEMLNRLNGLLGNFDREVDDAVEKVNEVGEEVVRRFQNFPNAFVYHGVLLMLIFILNLLCLYLVYYIYKWITERNIRFDKEVRRYKKKVYSMIDEKRPGHSFVSIEAPEINCHEYLYTED